LAKLDSLASIVPLDVASVEAAHGRVRRRLLNSSHSTDLQEMPQCNAEWVCAETRRRHLDLSRYRGSLAFTSKPRVRVQQKPKVSHGVRALHGKAHKAKGGGQCRAFMSLSENSGKTFAQLHREYARLTTDEKEARARQLGATKMSAKRTLQRELARRSASQKLQLASHAEDRDLPQTLQDQFVAQADPSVQNLEKRARLDAHWQARAKSEPLKALARDLATFAVDSKTHSRDLLSPLLGESEVFADCFHRVPSAFAHFDFHLPIDKLASRILASCSSHSDVHQRFLRELAADWELRNGMVMGGQGDIAKHTVSRCALAGLCLCTGVGKKAAAMRNAWYLKAFMPHFRQGMPERSLVDTARIVAKLSGHKVAPDGTNVIDIHWWSLALQYWSPKRVTFF